MKFSYTIIYVKDVQDSIKFYEQAFGIKLLFLHESKQYAELDTGATKLAFASEAMAELNKLKVVKNDKSKISPAIEIAFVCENIREAFKKACENGAIKLNEPEIKPWGQEVAHVKDLNGIIVEICSPMGG